MKAKIISWLKANGTVYQEDFIEIIYYQKDKLRLVFDIDLNKIFLIEYDDEDNIYDVNEVNETTNYETLFEIFGI